MRPNHAIDSFKLGVIVVVTTVEWYDVLVGCRNPILGKV
jgi:hypothetical protein